MKIIAIEEHCFTQYMVDYLQSRKDYPRLEKTQDATGQGGWRWCISAERHVPWIPADTVDKLCDLGEGRLKAMDEAGIDVQVLSCSMSISHLDFEEGPQVARKINDIFAEAIRNNPDRYAGFAALFFKNPEASADELERTVTKLGFKGALVPSHVDGEFLDDKKYWPVFARAAKLGVPIYIHPTQPPPERFGLYMPYRELATAMWGYAAEAGLTALRLICSGIFDEYPELKIILGHMGEALPFWMSRLDNRLLSSTATSETSDGATAVLSERLGKLPSQYIKENFYITPSGVLWEPALHCAQEALGTDKIMFAVDYPFEPNDEIVHFMETVPISNADKEKIFHINAERLLGL